MCPRGSYDLNEKHVDCVVLYLGSRVCVCVIVLSCIMHPPQALLEKEESASKQEKQAEKHPISTGSSTPEIQRLLAIANAYVPVCEPGCESCKRDAIPFWMDDDYSYSEVKPSAKQEQKRTRKSEKETDAKAPGK